MELFELTYCAVFVGFPLGVFAVRLARVISADAALRSAGWLK